MLAHHAARLTAHVGRTVHLRLPHFARGRPHVVRGVAGVGPSLWGIAVAAQAAALVLEAVKQLLRGAEVVLGKSESIACGPVPDGLLVEVTGLPTTLSNVSSLLSKYLVLYGANRQSLASAGCIVRVLRGLVFVLESCFSLPDAHSLGRRHEVFLRSMMQR